MHVVGSRGDVQPFVALGQTLRKHGHRVRLATHPTFKKFVEENGLEFFDIGGDPAELMAFMVKNPGLIPSMDSFKAGDVGKRRKEMDTIIKGCWRSCYEAGDGTGTSPLGEGYERRESLASNSSSGSRPLSEKPFIADAIIANPPSFAHIHCAEKLGIPLHLMFT
jgi:UDP:flavonoid glycosyltransferase YjiC (YdhE family)